MNVDIGLVAGLATLIIAIVGVAASLGALHQKVKFNTKNIDEIWADIRRCEDENKADHIMITNKLDTIIRNGFHKGG